MADRDTLKRMIRVEATVPLQPHYAKRKAVLAEDAARYSIEVNNVPNDALAIDIDTHFKNDRLFASAKGACKRADYIIVSETEKTILFIEMKKGDADTRAIIQQLKGGLCAFEYCQSIAREFYGKRDFLADYKKRFVAIARIHANKKWVRRKKRAGPHDTPENPLLIKYMSTVRFNELAA